jgi:hypothetical protein
MQQVQYVINDKGKKVSAIVPIRKWEMLTKRCQKLQHEQNILLGIKESLEEIKHAEKTGEKLQTLDEFLNEIKRKNYTII